MNLAPEPSAAGPVVGGPSAAGDDDAPDGTTAAGDPAAGEGTASGPAGEPVAGSPAALAASPAPKGSGLRGRLRRRLPRLTFHSRRGRLIALILFASLGSLLTVGGVAVLNWTETADFCGRCHTMGPELKAHEISPHRELACAECHVEPGVGGWVKAKFNGAKQLIQVITGNFPTPIPPPDHADLPPTSATCRRCHDVDALVANGGPVKLVLRTRFRSDAANTRDSVALVLRPAGFGGTTATRGVHWHIDSDVEFASSDPRSQTIDYVTVTNPDGTTDEFLALNQAPVPTNVQPDVDRVVAADGTRRLDCIDCHNRAGHAVPTLDRAIDEAIDVGKVDQTLPYIKSQALQSLGGDYPTEADADRAIDGIRGYYATKYPLVAATKAASINKAISELKTIYVLVATPEMRVTASTYPDNLGHTASPGCFRCHDGAHYKVVGGALTSETIPFACATCHTFPQIGQNTSGILIGQRPATHDDRLWVFDHKAAVNVVDPASTSCGACHTRTYCQNCHATPAVNVPHDDMVFNHAAVIRKTGAQACVLCHQATYCVQCHASDVLAGGPGPSPSP